MMNLKRFAKPRKKPLLILAVVTVGIITLASGGWWYNAYRATNDYRAQVGQYTEGVKKELLAATAPFKALAQEADGKKSIDALVQLRSTLTKQASGLPALPQLFGVALAAAQELEILAKDVQAAHDLLAYQQNATDILQEVTIKTGANAEQQKALAEAWQTMVNKLKALAPPNEASGIHQQIIAAAAAVQAKLAALPDLFTKRDTSGFAAQQKEIETHISEIRAHGDALQLLNVHLDKAIARDYQKLLGLLK
jgi:hypothetical protein